MLILKKKIFGDIYFFFGEKIEIFTFSLPNDS